jgi:hypothetical protein
MKQYRVTFKHSPVVCGNMVVEPSGSCLVAAESPGHARAVFVSEIQKRVELSITSIACLGDMEEYSA